MTTRAHGTIVFERRLRTVYERGGEREQLVQCLLDREPTADERHAELLRERDNYNQEINRLLPSDEATTEEEEEWEGEAGEWKAGGKCRRAHRHTARAAAS